MTAQTMAPAATFLLTADELHVLESRSPHIVLPSAFSTQWGEEVGEVEIEARERLAVSRLQQRGLLSGIEQSGPIPADLTDHVNPEFGRFISIPQFSTVAVDTANWTLQRTAIQSISALGRYAVELLRTQRVDHADGQPPAKDEDTVEVRAFTIEGVADQLLRPLTAWDDASEVSGRPRGAIALPMVDAEALVLALRDGHPDIIAGVVERVQHPEAAAVFGGIAARVDGGFTLKAISRLSGRRWSRAWLRGADGWVAIAIDSPRVTEDLTAEAFRDGTGVVLQAVRKADIIADVLAFAVEILEETA